MPSSEIKVTVKADNSPFLESIKQCTSELNKFSQVNGDIKFDTGKIEKVESVIKSLSAALKSLDNGKSIQINADASPALAALKETDKALRALQGANIRIGINKEQTVADIKEMQQALSGLSLNLGNININSSDVKQAVQELKKLRSGDIEIKVRSQEALTEIQKISEALKTIKSVKANIKVDGSNAKEEIQKIVAALQEVRSAIKVLTVKINSRQALNNITRLISAAQRLRSELNQINIPPGLGNALAEEMRRVIALNRQLLVIMRQISEESNRISSNVRGAGRASDSMLSKLGNLSLIASGIAQAFSMIKDMAASIVMPGFNYTKDMEMNQLGIAGILQSMTLLNGQAVSFGDAMGISSDMMKELRKDAINTGATTDELVTAFRALLAPGIGAGMNLGEIQKFTTTGVNAVKSIGLNSTQFVQELRDLVQGGIQASSSTLATSLGLTDADIKAAKASSEGLFKFLMDRMVGFAEVQNHFPDTLEGRMSKLKEVSVAASAEITEAFKGDFIDIVTEITDFIGVMDLETGEIKINPAILETIADMKDLWQDFLDMIADTSMGDDNIWDSLKEIMKSLYSIILDVTAGFMDFFRVVANSELARGVMNILKISAKGYEFMARDFKDYYDERARSLGVKQDRSAEHTEKAKRDREREEKSKGNQGVDASGLTGKYESTTAKEAAEKAEKERIKLAQKAYKEMIAYWKLELERVIRAIEESLNLNQAKYDQGYIGADEYHLKKLFFETQQYKVEIDELKKEYEAQKNLVIDPKNESDKQAKLSEVQKKIEQKQNELDKKDRAYDDIVKAMEKVNVRTADSVPGLIAPQNNMGQLAQNVSNSTGVPMEWIYAQWAHESKNFTSKLARENNNFGGLTQIENNGTENKQPDGDYYYMKFASPEKYAEYFAKYLSKYYPDAVKATSVEEYASALRAGGYYDDSYSNYVGGMKAHLNDMKTTAVPQVSSGEGGSWYRVEKENPKYEALEDRAKQALDLVADYVYKLTGEAVGLTSGKRSADLGYAPDKIGGHGNGLKFDIMSGSLFNEQIRAKVIAYAESIGLKVLDEIANPTSKATGEHLDLDATNLKVGTEGSSLTQNVLKDTGFMSDKDSAAWKTAHENEMNKVLEIMENFYEGVGNVSSIQIQKLETETDKTIRLLEAQNLPAVAEMARQVTERNKRKLKFTQIQKDIEYAYDDIAETQEELLYEMGTGIKDGSQVIEQYLIKSRGVIGVHLKELQNQLNISIAAGDRDSIREIKKKMREVIDTISGGIRAILDKIEADTNKEIEKIQTNKRLTNFQKEDAIDAVRLEASRKKKQGLELELTNLQKIRPNIVNDKDKDAEFKTEHGVGIDQAILGAKEQLDQLNYQLEQTPTLLDNVHMAGKQAFEDGLFDFLTEGVFQCESLGDAFRNLAITVLQAIQKMYAEALTKNIMNALFPPNSIPNAGSSSSSGSGFSFESGFGIDYGFAEGGHVVGEGTSTSDSILARLSNGEFVINAAAVKRVGLNALHRINNGMAFQIPMPKFASGGLVGERQSSIPNFAATAVNQSMGSMGESMSASFNPEITVRNTFDGNGFMRNFEPWIKSQIDKGYDRNMQEKAKLQSMLMKRMR